MNKGFIRHQGSPSIDFSRESRVTLGLFMQQIINSPVNFIVSLPLNEQLLSNKRTGQVLYEHQLHVFRIVQMRCTCSRNSTHIFDISRRNIVALCCIHCQTCFTKWQNELLSKVKITYKFVNLVNVLSFLSLKVKEGKVLNLTDT